MFSVHHHYLYNYFQYYVNYKYYRIGVTSRIQQNRSTSATIITTKLASRSGHITMQLLIDLHDVNFFAGEIDKYLTQFSLWQDAQSRFNNVRIIPGYYMDWSADSTKQPNENASILKME